MGAFFAINLKPLAPCSFRGKDTQLKNKPDLSAIPRELYWVR
jgi:hypothetical protein